MNWFFFFHRKEWVTFDKLLYNFILKPSSFCELKSRGPFKTYNLSELDNYDRCTFIKSIKTLSKTWRMVSRNSCRCKTCVVICRQSTFTSIYLSTHSLTFWQHYNCTADNILYTTFLLFSLFPDWSRDYPKWSMVNERESLLKMEIFSPHFSPELDIVEGHCW